MGMGTGRRGMTEILVKAARRKMGFELMTLGLTDRIATNQ